MIVRIRGQCGQCARKLPAEESARSTRCGQLGSMRARQQLMENNILDAARELYEELRRVESRAVAARKAAGLPFSRRAAAGEAGRGPNGVELDSRRISSWLPSDASAAQIPRAQDADKVWALVKVWAAWAGDSAGSQRRWASLIDAAQPARIRVSPSNSSAVGQLISDLDDPYALEVHKAIGVEALSDGIHELPMLPIYVPRDHDARLADVASRAVEGTSGILALVGGSSTGKTRACWEVLRGLPADWRVWHPIFPDRAEAFLAELDRVERRTVIWLNEAQHYLLTPDSPLGGSVAAGVRDLLRDRGRAPVLVLCTLWPQYWETLTAGPMLRGLDPHSHAKELLAGAVVEVPDKFTGSALEALQTAAEQDPRLAEAARAAQHGQVTQYLAGVPVLMERYRIAPPAAKALINAAINAVRMGHRQLLTHALLEAATPGYMTDHDWDQAGDDWLEQALTYATAPCNGIPGIVVPVRERPAGFRDRKQGGDSGWQSLDPTADPRYRVADYISQVGHRERKYMVPPVSFWEAAVYADPRDIETLAHNAERFSLFRHQAQILKKAAETDTHSATLLVNALSSRNPRAVEQAVNWVAAHAHIGGTWETASLLKAVGSKGQHGARTTLAARAAATAPLDDGLGTILLEELTVTGEISAARSYAMRLAAGVHVESPFGIRKLFDTFEEAGMTDLIPGLAMHVTETFPADNVFTVAALSAEFRRSGAANALRELLDKFALAAEPAEIGRKAARLLAELQETSARDAITAAAAALIETKTISLKEGPDEHWFLASLRFAEKFYGQSGLTQRPNDTFARVPSGPLILLEKMGNAGFPRAAGLMADYLSRTVNVDSPLSVGELLDSLASADAREAMVVLTERVARITSIDSLSGVSALLTHLHEIGEAEAVAAVAKAAARADLESFNLYSIPGVLQALGNVGAAGEARELAKRAAQEAPLSRLDLITPIIEQIFSLGANEALKILVERIERKEVIADTSSGYGNELAILITQMSHIDAQKAVENLAALAISMPLHDVHVAARILRALRIAHADRAANIFAQRAAQVNFARTREAFPMLIDELRLLGADEAAAAVTEKMENALSVHEPSKNLQEYRPITVSFDDYWLADKKGPFYGMETNGTPSDPWNWSSLI